MLMLSKHLAVALLEALFRDSPESICPKELAGTSLAIGLPLATLTHAKPCMMLQLWASTYVASDHEAVPLHICSAE